ncbi:two-component system, OmpR family, sensor histidine kinase KdpD [Rhodoblastus acidophilus]|uniref:histidine kinase n=1 Tax=Rhodoblastus acidophilus TaxID=1074 RepID=A0A212RSJ1_RHOAC|nr:sensor histidine kinase KdpD [Rhodoblastus acidophilus]PPQ40676.1 sensor histidine kinase KdpD [Rhodoblastus acidophilus]RAI21945.1 sensor histidine kinase KdpD [Rhodoblastus acidophilus]SNB75572.1 two-component system, OmpR family, sensor histidine kinase KdpD [Rhodoblastus acidophilus]
MSENASDRRPDPDALLALADEGRRGRLKVFLGAAPGVGKTYAMLQNARRLKAEGVDVLIGLVETHGRAETAALVEGLDVLPRREIAYRGRTIEEFDLDSALARRPKLIVVDELAHSNAPDSRHPKRWQDVEDLLDAGIDVWTALNIQHLESLADVVSRVTGVTVRETVPDGVLQKAQDVVLVDITPAELIERLREGKVYLPETAKRATQKFFTPGNLTALRELALRRTADRVDDQMVDYLRQNAIEGPWETSDYLLVCLDADAGAEKLVRAASRLATRLNAAWIVVHAERPGHQESDPVRLKRLDSALHLAERLGAETRRLTAADRIGEILRLARRENVTQIVVGRPRETLWRRLTGSGFVATLAAQAPDIALYTLGAPEPPPRKRVVRIARPARLWTGFAAAIGAVAAAVGVGHALTLALDLPNLSMVFLLAVLGCAATYGPWSAVAASFLSFLAYNFFFIPPIHTFTVAEPQEVLSLLVFLIVAVATGSLAGRVHDQATAASRRAEAIAALYAFSRKLAGAARLDDVLWASATHLHRTQGGSIVLLLPQDGELQLRTAWPPDRELSAGEVGAAQWAFDKQEASGWRTNTLPNLAMQFRPLLSPRGAVGVCGFTPLAADAPLAPEQERELTALLEQTALAIDRSLLIGEAVRAAALEDNEKLRTTLLSSLSHDLRTPLSSITGAVTTLRQFGAQMPEEDREDLLASIEEEAARLSRFVANLLDMSRIESGALKLRRDMIETSECVRAAAERSRRVFPQFRIETSVARDLPFIQGDAQMLEQVLFNLLDNAHKYGGERGAVIHARQQGDKVVISVTDDGPGVKPADLVRIFEKFFRGGRSDGRKAGTGLGLSICKGLVEAMGGTIEAQSPAARRRGTRILLRFPAARMKMQPET